MVTTKEVEEYYKSRSFWMESCEEQLNPRPKLTKSISSDVAILGAGFTGLWIAYYLKSKQPELKISILEKDIAGYGASGRNGGWCSPKFSLSPHEMIKRYGVDIARQLNQSLFDAVNEIGKVIETEKMDVDWTLGGSLEVARGDYAIPLLEKKMEVYNQIGIEDEFEFLTAEETDKRVKINGTKKSMFTKTSAVLNPAKLVRQLASLLENKGVDIYEQTEVVEYKGAGVGKSPSFITSHGTVTAKHAIVISGESYISQLPPLKRSILPMYSLITLTEPLSEDQWNQIGWEGRESIGSTRLSIDYLQKTKDGRILIGGRGQPYRYGSKISDTLDRHKETHHNLENRLKEWFPSLKDIKFSHAWGGPVGITRDWLPNLFFNEKTRIAGAWGFAGQGVSTSNLAGRILSELLLGEVSPNNMLPIVNHTSRNWEIEPFRWLGARYVQTGLEKVDKKAETSGKTPNGKTLAERLGKH